MKEFIVSALSSIVDAVVETQQKYTECKTRTPIVVNPVTKLKQSITERTETPVNNVHFDLSVAVQGKVDGKAKLAVIGMGGEVKEEGVQRVSFDISISFPTFNVLQAK